MRLPAQQFILVFILFILFFSTLPVHSTSDHFVSTNLQTLSYQQEISIPIDTSQSSSAYQPIDTRVTFEHSCWAQNETIHSIRIGYDDGSGIEEIESQIYDLSHIDENHIDSCSIVFLIPKDATGQETYYIYYDDQATDPVSYKDHITIKDTHYYYEPISGQIMDFDYYRITEDDHIVYALCQKGELLGNGMSNAIIKLLPNSTVFTTTNAEQIASFYMSYSTDPSGTNTGSQWATDIKKTILVDGNLMTRIQIQGTSPKKDIKTDNIYTYYYCPSSAKHLHVNVHHEILEDITVEGTKQREGTYASLSTIKARSGTIKDMNLGTILPKIHIYTEDETTKTYDIPTDPSADPAEWLLGTTDDQDLGSKAWFCIDDPNSGKAHGLLFAKNSGILEGPHDGVQVKASVKEHVNLLGLEADSGDLYALRNAYEDGTHSTDLTKGTSMLFDVQYLSLQSGGYEAIDQESTFYQPLSEIRPITRGNVSETKPEQPTDRYMLTASVHFAPSFPLGSLLSALTGRNISYLSAELYKSNDFISSGAVSRLKIGEIPDSFDNTSFIEKINLIRGIFNLKNSTFAKTIRFDDVEPGTYLIKIYKENPLRGSNRQYIGYGITEITEDTTIRITCSKETHLKLTVTDQRQNPVQGVIFCLNRDDVIITEEYTNENGTALLSFPFSKRQSPRLTGLYQGFQIIEQPINLKTKHRFTAMEITKEINVYDYEITVKDTLGLPPAVPVNPMLTSNEMSSPETLQPSSAERNEIYVFNDVYPASYKLKMSYKSFILEETITVQKESTAEFVFPAEFVVDCCIRNQVGNMIDKAAIQVQRSGKTVSSTISNGNAKLIVPPGQYTLDVKQSNDRIASQTLSVKGDKSIEIITSQPSLLHQLAPLLIIVLFGGLMLYFYWKKTTAYSIHLLLISLLLLSLFFPWWMLSGEHQSVTTTTTTLLYPARIITLTTTDQIIGGDIASVPEEFTMILQVISSLLLATTALIIIKAFIKTKLPKLSTLLSYLIVILLIISPVLFYVAMSEVTKVGVGSFMDADTVSISIPGEATQIDMKCHWGPSIGFYLTIIALIIALFFQFRIPIQKLISKSKRKISR